MLIKKNTKNRVHFIYDKCGKVETFMFTPVKNSRQKTLLTFISGKTRLDLNGHQVNSLRKLLEKADNLSTK